MPARNPHPSAQPRTRTATTSPAAAGPCTPPPLHLKAVRGRLPLRPPPGPADRRTRRGGRSPAALAINIHESAAAGAALPGPESEKLCRGAATIAPRFRLRDWQPVATGSGSPRRRQRRRRRRERTGWLALGPQSPALGWAAGGAAPAAPAPAPPLPARSGRWEPGAAGRTARSPGRLCHLDCARRGLTPKLLFCRRRSVPGRRWGSGDPPPHSQPRQERCDGG